MAWSLLVALGAVSSLLDWLYRPALPLSPTLPAPAAVVLAAGMGYLLWTAAVHLRLGLALRRGVGPKGGWTVLLAGHVAVLLISARTFWAGHLSAALLVGHDVLVAALAVTSLVSSVLLSLAWWSTVGGSAAQSKLPRLWWMLHAVLSILVVVSFFYLEWQPRFPLGRG